jgi:hypothetical protein
MKQLVRTELVDGGVMFVEVEEIDESAVAPTPSGRVTRGGISAAEVPQRLQTSFEAALAQISPTAEQLVAQLVNLKEPPDQVGLEFGLTMTASAGVVLASAGLQANFKVSLTWHRKPQT